MAKSLSLHILQLSPQDIAGGAERVALDLHNTFRHRSVDARLLVRFMRRKTPGVLEADVFDGTPPWSLLFKWIDRLVASRPHFRGRDSIRSILGYLALPQRWRSRRQGLDDWNYPYSWTLLSDQAWQPSIIHLHNMHGNYFDLRALARLSRSVPLVWTLHDGWALTGHCAYFIDCTKWQSGCGKCPDLSRAPSVRQDRTDVNWRHKELIYVSSKLHIVTPSRWLMARVDESMLSSASRNVIPLGVDLRIFHPADKSMARQQLGLPEDMFICLFVGMSGSSQNPYKDYPTVSRAMDQLIGQSVQGSVLFICVGGQAQPANSSQFPPYFFTGRIGDSFRLAQYYQAADVFLHAANADNFPLTVLEAQACGLPVIATDVGGIGEQIEEGETGWLVPRGDSIAMVERVYRLLQSPELRQVLSRNAVQRAIRLFDLDRQVNDYLELYQTLLAETTVAREMAV